MLPNISIKEQNGNKYKIIAIPSDKDKTLELKMTSYDDKESKPITVKLIKNSSPWKTTLIADSVELKRGLYSVEYREVSSDGNSNSDFIKLPYSVMAGEKFKVLINLEQFDSAVKVEVKSVDDKIKLLDYVYYTVLKKSTKYFLPKTNYNNFVFYIDGVTTDDVDFDTLNAGIHIDKKVIQHG